LALSILVILVGSALIGLKVLSIFNISLDVFRIVGGMIIAYMGFDMLRRGHTPDQAPPIDAGAAPPNPPPPAVRLAARPGATTALGSWAAWHAAEGLPVPAIVAAVVGAAITYSVLLLVIGVGSRLGGGTQAIVTRFMGLIVASMGMQFVLTGLKEFLSL